MTVTYLPATQVVHEEASRQNFEYIESHFHGDTLITPAAGGTPVQAFLPTVPYASLGSSTTQNVLTGTTVPVTMWNSVPFFGGGMPQPTNVGIKVPIPGIYHVSGNFLLLNPVAAVARVDLTISINGLQQNPSWIYALMGVPASQYWDQPISGDLKLAAGDVVTLMCAQSTGATMTIGFGNTAFNYMSLYFVSNL